MKKENIVLLGVILLALALRLPGILRGDFAFTFDTGRDLLAIRDLVATGDVHLIGHTTGLMGFFYGPWWYWFLTIPFLIVGGNPIGMTASIALTGAAAAALAFWWGARTFGFLFGTVLGVLLAASPGVITITNQLWNPHLLLLTTTLVIILMRNIGALTGAKLVLLGFLLGLLTEFEIVFGVLFLLGFVLSSALWLRPYLSARKILAIALGFGIVQAPRILFELRNGFVQVRAFLGAFGDSQNAWQLYTKREWLIWGSLSSVLPGPPWLHMLLTIIFLYILAHLFQKFSKLDKRFVLTILTIISIFWVTTFVYPRDFWNYYMYGLPVLYAILVSMVLSFLWQQARRVTRLFLLVYFVALLGPVSFFTSIVRPHFIGDAAVYRNQREVVRATYNEAKTDFKYIAYTPPQLDYTWQYLFWFEGQKGQGFRVREDSPIMYVIIEPDVGYPDRPKKWLEVRKNDGIVISERKFPSGIVVQTRSLPSYEPGK